MSLYEMPGDILQRHAYDNVWCTPDQDNQIQYTPARISPLNGHWVTFEHMWRRIKLPTKTDHYHIFQIGGINPLLLGMSDVPSKWITIPEAMKRDMLIADFFTGNGFQIPRCLVYFYYTEDRNLLMAVQKPAKDLPGWDWEADKVHFRFYSNEYYNSIRSDEAEQYIGCLSERIMDRVGAAAFMDKVAAMPYSRGIRYYFVNGRYAASINAAQVDDGDYVDCVYDSSIKKVVDLPLASLQEFNSTLDGVRKLLVHYAGTDENIEYHDDVDFFIWKNMPANRTRGAYIHKLDKRTIRMVTHRDYALAMNVVEAIRTNSPFIQSGDELFIRMHIRNSGYQRPLVFEKNRIHELYRLKPEQVLSAMLGYNSNVTEWRAETLEAAQYPAIMRAQSGTISRQMVQQAYGYHAITKIIGDTPVKTRVFSGQTVADVPVGLINRATCYEYDANGALLGYQHNGAGSVYPCMYPNCALVEMVYGRGGVELDIADNVAEGSISLLNNYRYYWCDNVGGMPAGEWRNADAGVVLITETSYKWVANPSRYTRVLGNSKHLVQEFDYTSGDGLITFNLTYQKGLVLKKLDMPLGELDVWLNRKLLIEGLDYVVINQQVYILNKTHLVGGGYGAQNIVWRFKGFCTEDFKHRELDEKGFIVHDTVSYNHIYNVRNDHVVRIGVNGRVYHRDDLKFAEDGVLPAALAANNGKPYGVRNTVMPLNNYVVGEVGTTDATYRMLQEAQEADKRISEYLTLHRPQVDVADLSYIPNKYAVTSPFFANIICDLRDGILWNDQFTQHYGNAFVEQMCKPYEHLLDVDLIGGDDRYDDRYVVIHPHPYSTYVGIGIYQHKFLRFVQDIYGQGRVDIANHVMVLPFGN